MPSNGADPVWVVVLVVVVLGLVGLALRPRWQASGWKFGTAYWTDEGMLRAAGMLSGPGLVLGRTKRGALIRHNAYNHLSVFAPTGAGKAVSFLVPWLLSWRRGSLIVLDVKGELYTLTARRRRAMGQKVWRLDPFGVCGPNSDAWNPFDLIRPGPAIVDAIRPLAEAMVIRSPEGDKDPHWNDRATDVLVALLVLVVMQLPPEDRNLSSLRDLIADPETPKDAPAILRSKGGIFSRIGGAVAVIEDKERSGIYSTVHRHTSFADSPGILSVSDKSTIAIRELLDGNVALYVILPPSQVEAQNRWLRLIIASVTRLIGQEGMRRGKECLMLLDEAGQLGHMSPLEQGLTLLRSYGLKMAFFFQSAGQLRSVFRDKESVLLDNTEQIYFGTQSYETADRISRMLGNSTIAVESANDTETTNWQGSKTIGLNEGKQRGRSFSRSYSEKERALLDPSEVLRLDPRYVIVFLRCLRAPLLCRRVFWYADPAFRPARRSSCLLLIAAAIGAALAARAFVR